MIANAQAAAAATTSNGIKASNTLPKTSQQTAKISGAMKGYILAEEFRAHSRTPRSVPQQILGDDHGSVKRPRLTGPTACADRQR